MIFYPVAFIILSDDRRDVYCYTVAIWKPGFIDIYIQGIFVPPCISKDSKNRCVFVSMLTRITFYILWHENGLKETYYAHLQVYARISLHDLQFKKLPVYFILLLYAAPQFSLS